MVDFLSMWHLFQTVLKAILYLWQTLHFPWYILASETFHFCAVTLYRPADNRCSAHLFYRLWLSHSHVLGERPSLGDRDHSTEPRPSSLLAGVREDDHLLPQLPSDWTTAFPYGTVPLSIVCLSLLSVCLQASALHLTCVRGALSLPFMCEC